MNQVEETVLTDQEKQDQTHIIQTDSNNKDGINKCIKCGSSDIALNIKTGKLRCSFCRYEFSSNTLDELKKDISYLKGDIIASGFHKIEQGNDIITLKCSGCGAEVVIDSLDRLNKRCHWCRNTLSINKQIPNGAVPDLVLPFKISKEDAKQSISSYIRSHKLLASPKFRKEFDVENVVGVYLPYLIVDSAAKCDYEGLGEEEIRRYTIPSGKHRKIVYDVKSYRFQRQFNIKISNLTLESNAKRLDNSNTQNTNYIVNSIMPFDTENCVAFNANYLRNFSSERRNLDLDKLRPKVNKQIQTICGFQLRRDLNRQYNRGVRYEKERVDIQATRWITAYLPVWIYSYYEEANKRTHYVAVNARTKETAGSIPVNHALLGFITTIITLVGLFTFIAFDERVGVVIMVLAFVYMYTVLYRYRRYDARHYYEYETKSDIQYKTVFDEFLYERNRVSHSRIEGENSNVADFGVAVGEIFGARNND